MINKLIKLARALDKSGAKKGADKVSGIIKIAKGPIAPIEFIPVVADLNPSTRLLQPAIDIAVRASPAARTAAGAARFLGPIGTAISIVWAIYEANENAVPREQYWEDRGFAASHCPGGCHGEAVPPGEPNPYLSFLPQNQLQKKTENALYYLLEAISAEMVSQPEDIQMQYEVLGWDNLYDNYVKFTPPTSAETLRELLSTTEDDDPDDNIIQFPSNTVKYKLEPDERVDQSSKEKKKEFRPDHFACLATSQHSRSGLGTFTYHFWLGGIAVAEAVELAVFYAQMQNKFAVFQAMQGAAYLGNITSTTYPGAFTATGDDLVKICNMPRLQGYWSVVPDLDRTFYLYYMSNPRFEVIEVDSGGLGGPHQIYLSKEGQIPYPVNFGARKCF